MFNPDLNVDEVFGISRDPPKNYVIRSNVDNVFVDNLARDRHIVIHGSSKQGKTSLRKYHLKTDDYIIVSCLNNWSMRDLFAAILKRGWLSNRCWVTKNHTGPHYNSSGTGRAGRYSADNTR
jgi:hypothetical protein